MRGFGSRASVFLGGQERSPETQPFHIVNRQAQLGSNKRTSVGITKTSQVNQANEFKEIANNFANPLEKVREAVGYSIEAKHLVFCLI